MSNRPSPLGQLSSQGYVKDFDIWAVKYLKTYSRRAFAKWAGIPSSNFLTLIISGKRPFQSGWIKGFAKAAKLDESELKYLKNLIRYEQCKSLEEKSLLLEQLNHFVFTSKLYQLDQKELFLISSPDIWSLYIGLSLEVTTKDQASSLKKSLNMELGFIREALDMFKRLQLAEESPLGHLIAKYKFLSTENEHSRIANLNFHKKALDEAKEKLIKIPHDQRSFGSLTLLVNQEEYSTLQEDIQNFGKNLMSKYSENKSHKRKELLTRVNIQLYPLTEENKS